MSKPTPKKKLTCKVVSGVLRIEIGIETLKGAAERHEGFWQPETDKYALVVSNPKQFAKDVRSELETEDETGSTPVHYLLDKAIEEATNNGSEGLDHDAMSAIEYAELRARQGEISDDAR